MVENKRRLFLLICAFFREQFPQRNEKEQNGKKFSKQRGVQPSTEPNTGECTGDSRQNSRESGFPIHQMLAAMQNQSQRRTRNKNQKVDPLCSCLLYICHKREIDNEYAAAAHSHGSQCARKQAGGSGQQPTQNSILTAAQRVSRPKIRRNQQLLHLGNNQAPNKEPASIHGR